jgi:hypothetical protein
MKEREALRRASRARPAPKADARYNKTRKALLDAGLDLLSDLSEDGINVDEIVRRAGVAKGSFYNLLQSLYRQGGARQGDLSSTTQGYRGAHHQHQ